MSRNAYAVTQFSPLALYAVHKPRKTPKSHDFAMLSNYLNGTCCSCRIFELTTQKDMICPPKYRVNYAGIDLCPTHRVQRR